MITHWRDRLTVFNSIGDYAIQGITFGDSTKMLMKGTIMTRVCAAANDNILCVGSDTLYIHDKTRASSCYGKKVFSNNNIIVAVLGTLDLQSSIGDFHIQKVVEKCLKMNSDFLSLIDSLKKEVGQIYCHNFFHYFTQFAVFGLVNEKFYMYYFQISSGLNSYECSSPFGNIYDANKENFKFNHHMLTLGQGVYNNYAIIQGHYENPVDEVKCNIHSAISDKELQTVGGKCQYQVISRR